MMTTTMKKKCSQIRRSELFRLLESRKALLGLCCSFQSPRQSKPKTGCKRFQLKLDCYRGQVCSSRGRSGNSWSRCKSSPTQVCLSLFHSARRCEWAEYGARDRLGCYIFVDKTSAVERSVSHIWLAAMSVPVTEVSVLEHRVGMLLTRLDLAQSHIREAKVCPVCVYDV